VLIVDDDTGRKNIMAPRNDDNVDIRTGLSVLGPGAPAVGLLWCSQLWLEPLKRPLCKIGCTIITFASKI
jgi:hypothetical protein